MPRINTKTGKVDDGLAHWKLMGRTYCKAKKPKLVTVINNDVTCPACKEAVTEAWNALVGKLTPEHRQAISKAP